jgi:hypothetical protein
VFISAVLNLHYTFLYLSVPWYGRQVTIRFADKDNITVVVEAFTEFYEVRDEVSKVEYAYL